MINFVNSIHEIPGHPASRVVLIDDSLLSKQDLIDKIEKSLDAPCEKENWDGLHDVLRDLDWLKESGVVLIHKALPLLTASDLRNYIGILDGVSREWEERSGGKDFQVYFLTEDKARIDGLLRDIAREKVPDSKPRPGNDLSALKDYSARCESCYNEMTLEKVVYNGAQVLSVLCHCPECGKKYLADFDKFYSVDDPLLAEIGEDGLDADGFDTEGYNREGYDSWGFDRNHLHKDTASPYDPSGYDWERYDAEGLDERGFDREGFYRKTGARYDQDGYDWHGYKENGYNKYGVDRFGKLPDGSDPVQKLKAKQRRQILIPALLISLGMLILAILKGLRN